MIDDFSVSSVNDSCIVHNKIDLHMIDTFAAMVKRFFALCDERGVSSGLVAKTYDLKSAYRQVPIRKDHLKFAYFSVLNHRLGRAQIYRLKTLPFGATHSVYSFLRLSRMLFALATQGLWLLTTNFYDDFILASSPSLEASSKNSMELLFILTGWDFLQRKAKRRLHSRMFAERLELSSTFASSGERILSIGNTETRRSELVAELDKLMNVKRLGKHDSLVLRGRLGFADSIYMVAWEAASQAAGGSCLRSRR